MLADEKNKTHKVELTIHSASSIAFDAVFVPSGKKALDQDSRFQRFVAEAYRHGKALAIASTHPSLIAASGYKLPDKNKADRIDDMGFLVSSESLTKPLIAAMKKGRFWDRETKL